MVPSPYTAPSVPLATPALGIGVDWIVAVVFAEERAKVVDVLIVIALTDIGVQLR